MKQGLSLSFLFIILLFAACSKKGSRNVVEPPEGAINLSELETKQDYYLPFAVVNDSSLIRSAVLNDEEIDFGTGSFIEFKENGYYELILKYNDPLQPDDTFLFTTTTEERAFSEWGIKAWVPAEPEYSDLGSEDVEIIYPRRFTDSIKVPFIFYVRESGSVKPVYCKGKCLSSGDEFNIKRGTGSVNIAASSVTGHTGFTIGGKSVSADLVKISDAPVSLNGSVNNTVIIPPNTLVRITGDLEIGSSGSLTVGEGSTILISEGCDINLNGPLIISGTELNPVFITCSRKEKYWGGFITRSQGGTINAKYTIFCQSGYHDSEEYAWGHAGRQALFYTENSTLTLDHCCITDHIGQVFYPENSSLNFDNILVQRVETGGQLNNSTLTLRNSVFTDFPDDSYIFSDNDNDALYLDGSDAVIENTTFMFAKDDGLDSGAGEGGEITVNSCWFEACFHEGAALSSIDPAVKNHYFNSCVFTNCGQGLELGYSSPHHTVVADNCSFLNNGVGIRYGDNYDWSEVDGRMLIRNSLSLNNDRDVWNMVRMTWSPKIENLSIENTMVSRFCPQYPSLEIKSNR
jgi:hypothetical protein